VTEPVRWGVLSTARIARRIVDGARAADGVQLMAVGSRDAGRAQAYARDEGIPVAYGSYEELLADPDLEAVYVPLPNSLHVEWTVKALEAGKHVLCEKPLAARAADAEAARDAARRSGRLFMEGFMWRFHPLTELVARLVREGAVGDVRLARAAFGFTLARPGDVRLEPGLDGGALMDVGCYCVSALRLVCGEPERVSGEASIGEHGVDVRFAGMLRFAGGALGLFDCGFDVAPRTALEVVGSEATLRVADPWRAKPPVATVERDGGVRTLEAEAVDPYARELAELSRAIRDGGAPRLAAEDAVGQARVIEALRAAAEQRRPVTPPAVG
jgi:predicted dehydrogenase